MTRHQMYAVLVGLLALWVGAGYVLHAQNLTAGELRQQLAARFEIVAMQRGIGLVPRQADTTVQLIQIVDGTVSVDGMVLTAAQTRQRLGTDAEAVIQLTYLTPDALRALANGAQAPQPSAPGRSDESRTVRRGGDRFRFGGPVDVAQGERVEGDVVAIFGPVNVDGEVMGDVVAVMGPLTLGPHALVHGDVQAVGGPMTRAPEAQVLGETHEVAIGSRIDRRWTMPDIFGSVGNRVGSFAATVARLLLFVLLGLVIVAALRRPVERIGATASAHPWRAALVGLLAEILFVPAVLVTVFTLVVSIVGIPLLLLVPFGIVLVCLVMLVGFVGAAYQAGAFALRRLGRDDGNAYVAMVVGTVIIGGMTLLAKLAAVAGGAFVGVPLGLVGYLIEYCAWTMGFGAAILAWLAMRRPTPPLSPPTMEPTTV